jgi:hypothetical protein
MVFSRRAFARALAAAVGLSPLLPPVGIAAFAAVRDGDDDDVPQNVFYSPCGQPFRAKPDQPYPVVQWFKQADHNHDGKVDRTEFLADAEGFFNALDRNKDGVLDSVEVAYYEQRIAPEILGYRVLLSADGRSARVLAANDGARLWLAQGDAPPPSSDDDNPPKIKADETKQGASPFGLFFAPEPVAAADLDFSGIITKPNFLKLADLHFTQLDAAGRGYLTLDALPKTDAQKAIEAYQRRRFKHS